ncbi:family 4 glycosyl hydrolase [Paraburkholderia sediminicola]|uniref:family 4 glycosyl hydrolase n=1 Tax=Paraburkholderia sediminicola TaxID=458836 RepID=UPI0038BD20E0
MKLTILGGSSPFTASFFRHAAAPQRPLSEFDTVVLQGRDEQTLERLAHHGRALLGGRRPYVSHELDLDTALREADVVLIQVRFGGTQWRLEVEHACRSRGLFADETLGVGGLATALHCRDKWRELGQRISDVCPRAQVVNMVNPLSLSCQYFGETCSRLAGLCEGPLQAVHDVAGALDCGPEALDWRYTGLNHRGFLHSLRYNGHDVDMNHVVEVSPRLAELYDPKLQAIVSKEWWTGQARERWTYGRATAVASVRARLRDDLLDRRILTREVLELRPTPWYSLAILPFLAAWSGRTGAWVSTTNVLADGLTVERRSVVTRCQNSLIPDDYPTKDVGRIVDALTLHERRCLEAIDHPSRLAVEEALSLDPTIGYFNVELAAEAVSQLCPL